MLWIFPLLGCESGPARPTEFQARPVQRGASYLVSDRGEPIGRIQELTIIDVEEDIRFWRIETLTGQWVGYADQWGAFYRYELFEERETRLGLYSMKDGLAELFGRTGLTWEPEESGLLDETPRLDFSDPLRLSNATVAEPPR